MPSHSEWLPSSQLFLILVLLLLCLFPVFIVLLLLFLTLRPFSLLHPSSRVPPASLPLSPPSPSSPSPSASPSPKPPPSPPSPPHISQSPPPTFPLSPSSLFPSSLSPADPSIPSFSHPPSLLVLTTASYLPLPLLLTRLSLLSSSWRASLYRLPSSPAAFAHLRLSVHRSPRAVTIEGRPIDASHQPSYFTSASSSLSSTLSTLLSTTLRYVPSVQYVSLCPLSAALTTVVPALTSMPRLSSLTLHVIPLAAPLTHVLQHAHALTSLDLLNDERPTDVRLLRSAMAALLHRPLIHLRLVHSLADAFLHSLRHPSSPPPLLLSHLQSLRVTLKRSAVYPHTPDVQMGVIGRLRLVRHLSVDFTKAAGYQPTLEGWCALSGTALAHLEVQPLTAVQLGVVAGLGVRSLRLREYAWGTVGLASVGAMAGLQALELDFAVPSLAPIMGLGGLRMLGLTLAPETRAANAAEVRRLLAWRGLQALVALKVRGTPYACDEQPWEAVAVGEREEEEDGPQPVSSRLQRLCLDGGMAALWSEGTRKALTARFGVWDERNVDAVHRGTPLHTWRTEHGLPWAQAN